VHQVDCGLCAVYVCAEWTAIGAQSNPWSWIDPGAFALVGAGKKQVACVVVCGSASGWCVAIVGILSDYTRSPQCLACLTGCSAKAANSRLLQHHGGYVGVLDQTGVMFGDGDVLTAHVQPVSVAACQTC